MLIVDFLVCDCTTPTIRIQQVNKKYDSQWPATIENTEMLN